MDLNGKHMIKAMYDIDFELGLTLAIDLLHYFSLKKNHHYLHSQ